MRKFFAKIDLYIISSMIPPFIYSIFLLLMIMLLDKIFNLSDLIFKKKIPPQLILNILFLSLPYILALVIPMSILVATLYAFGNMNQERELMALSTSGISLMRIIRVPLLFSIILFFFLIYFNGFFVPTTNHILKKKVYYMYRYKPSLVLKEGVFNKLGNISIYVDKKNEKGNILKNLKIFQKEKDYTQIINAEEGYIKSGKEGGYLLVLKNGIIQEKRKGEVNVRNINFKEHRIYIPKKTEENVEDIGKSDRELTLKELFEKIEKNKKIYLENKRENRFIFLQLQRFWVEVHKKLAIPFAAIAFVIIGVPLARIFGKAGWGSAFGLSIVVFTIHYIFLVGGEELGDRGIISTFIAMWTGDILTLILGLYLLYKFR